MLAEMENMAIDFQEEAYFKKIASMKFVRDAQRALIARKEKKKEKLV